MDFSNGKLVFTQSDMDKSNFFIDDNGNMCILDLRASRNTARVLRQLYNVCEQQPFRQKRNSVLGLAALFQPRIDGKGWCHLNDVSRQDS
ncbi:hypothetical protein M378DRAFT_165339, partial [Amanita muscaria Koide BX008]